MFNIIKKVTKYIKKGFKKVMEKGSILASEVLENMRYRAENEVLVEVTKGAVDLTRDAITGTVNLTRDAITGTVNLTRDAVTGTVNLTRDAVKCVSRNTKSILRNEVSSKKAAIMVGGIGAGLAAGLAAATTIIAISIYMQSTIKEASL